MLPISRSRWIVCCGTGEPDGRGRVYETSDRGDTWRTFDSAEYQYVREAVYADRLHFGANNTAPLWEPPEATHFIENDDGELTETTYLWHPNAFIISLTTSGEAVFAGTNDGRILSHRNGEWRQLEQVPIPEADQRYAGVVSLACLRP